MTNLFPKSCGRLVTAAFLIACGVVQLVAGLILMKSKYAYLLSAPNFWTAVSNFAVGGLLGVSASVWKTVGKTSSKHATRRNILCALMFSCLMINASTAMLLILGEGNALLSIQLESNGYYSSSTLNSEILAYAYATSVCSPIVCIVLSCVHMSGLCFRRSKSIEPKKKNKALDVEDGDAYNWVYKSKIKPKPESKTVGRVLSSKYLSSTSSDDESNCSSDSVHTSKCDSVPSGEDIGDTLQTTVPKAVRSETNGSPKHQERQVPDAEGRSLPRRGKNESSILGESSRIQRNLSREVSLPNFSRNLKKENERPNFNGSVIYGDNPREHGTSMRDSNWKVKSEVVTFGDATEENIKVFDTNQTSCINRKSLLKRPHSLNYQPVAGQPIVADVHLAQDESRHGYMNPNFSPEGSTVNYHTSPKEILAKNGENDACYSNRKMYRTYSEKSLKMGAMNDKINRPSSVRPCHSDISKLPEDFSVKENWIDGEFNLNSKETQKRTLKRGSNSLGKVQLVGTSAEIEQSFDGSPTECLAGEVVPIQVSTLPRKLSSKLIPVTIPSIASTTGRYSLKIAEASASKHFKNASDYKRRGTSLAKTSKFEGSGEPKLLSFKGGMKNKEYRNRKMKFPVACQHPPDPAEPSTSGFTEYRGEGSSPSSPTFASRYLSALEETLQSAETNIGDGGAVVCGSSTGITPDETVISFPGETSHHRQSLDAGKRVTNQLLGERKEKLSKKEMIDQLLNDPAFQKMVGQTLKETAI